MGEKAKIVFFGKRIPKKAKYVLRDYKGKVRLEDRTDSKSPLALCDFNDNALFSENLGKTIREALNLILEPNPTIFVQEPGIIISNDSESTTPKDPISWGTICIISH